MGVEIRFEHHDGPVETMDVKTWTIRTASGQAALRCPICGGIFEVVRFADPIKGLATVRCPWACCSFFEHIKLDDWQPIP